MKLNSYLSSQTIQNICKYESAIITISKFSSVISLYSSIYVLVHISSWLNYSGSHRLTVTAIAVLNLSWSLCWVKAQLSIDLVTVLQIKHPGLFFFLIKVLVLCPASKSLENSLLSACFTCYLLMVMSNDHFCMNAMYQNITHSNGQTPELVVFYKLYIQQFEKLHSSPKNFMYCRPIKSKREERKQCKIISWSKKV